MQTSYLSRLAAAFGFSTALPNYFQDYAIHRLRLRGNRKRSRMRTGYAHPFSSDRQDRRAARLAAKMRTTRTMNDDMLVRHCPKPATDGMDIARPSRQVMRAEQRRDAKARARNLKSARVPANWRQVIAMDRATAAARAAG